MTKTKYVVDLDDDLLKRARIAIRMESGEPVEAVIEAAMQRVINDEIAKHFAWLRDPDNGIDPSVLEDDD